MVGLDDNKKIGVGLIVLGLGFVTLGVIMLFDRSMIAIGNVLFLVGLCITVGVNRTWTLFTRFGTISHASECPFQNYSFILLNYTGKTL